MPRYLLSAWHDDDHEIAFRTPEAQRLAAACEGPVELRPTQDE